MSVGNRISRVTTHTGDDGSTGLADGSRVDKDDQRIDCIGNIDELNSMLGVVIASGVSDDIAGYLRNIQHRLFDIGGELASPGQAVLQQDSVDRLEELINTYIEDLPALKEFILPGGNMPGSLCHMVRTVCRRAERSVVSLSRNQYVNPVTVIYLNRLSDLLFVYARELVLKKGGKEVYWESERLERSA